MICESESVSVTKSDLSNLQVVCQIQRKFILCRLKERLFAVDQHAAAERVNVQWYQTNFEKLKCSRPLEYSQKINDTQFRLIEDERAALEDHGWRFKISRSLLEIFRAPAIGNIACNGNELIEFARGLEEGSAIIPLHRIVATAACHRSVRFGDFMNMEEMQILMDDLNRCDFPFQCAHGRPTIFPLPKITSSVEYIL